MPIQQQPHNPAAAYEEYFVPAIFEPLTGIVVDRAAPRPGERVLDVACGTGIVARRVASLVGASGRVVGVDVNPAMLDVARTQPSPVGGAAAIGWQQGDATALDIPDGCFDLVLCQQGLQFFPDPRAGAREMRRVLAPGGRAILAVWHGVDRHPLYDALAEAELPHLRALGTSMSRADLLRPFSMGDGDELRALLAESGFPGVEVASEVVEARFPTPERFVERMERAYAAVVPAFAQDPAAFDSYLDAIAGATAAIVEAHREGDWVIVPMHTHVVTAHAD